MSALLSSSEGGSLSLSQRFGALREVKEKLAGSLRVAIGSLQSIRKQQKALLEDEDVVFLQVGRSLWHAPRELRVGE